MAKRYSLNSDQQAQIKRSLPNRQQQMQALRQDTTLSRERQDSQDQGIRDDSSNKIQAVLNDTQKQKFVADQQNGGNACSSTTQLRQADPLPNNQLLPFTGEVPGTRRDLFQQIGNGRPLSA